jgi:hypothetical protein
MIEIKVNPDGPTQIIIQRQKKARNSAAVVHMMARPKASGAGRRKPQGNPKGSLETEEMKAVKAPGQRQQGQSQEPQNQFGSLDQRYGKIGISAVAGAVEHKGGHRKPDTPRRPYVQPDSD